MRIHLLLPGFTLLAFWGQMTGQDRLKEYFPEPKNGDTYVIAHRGVHNGIPENSLAAYQKAIDLGCDFIEIDVRKTRDGRIVSIHNSTIDAYVNGITGKVSDFTLAELKALDIGERVGPEWKNTRIPAIEEILQLCRGQIGIYLDLKEDLVDELLEIITEYEMERDIVWYIPAVHMDAIKRVKSHCSQCVPMPDPGPVENIAEVVSQVQPRVIATDMDNLSETYMKIAHGYNTKVFVDEDKGNVAEWTKILDWGTDGIQTDNPQSLIRFLSERGKEITLQLEPQRGNPRNSEGDLIQLKNGRILFIYTHFTGGSGDHASAYLAGRYSNNGGKLITLPVDNGKIQIRNVVPVFDN